MQPFKLCDVQMANASNIALKKRTVDIRKYDLPKQKRGKTIQVICNDSSF